MKKNGFFLFSAVLCFMLVSGALGFSEPKFDSIKVYDKAQELYGQGKYTEAEKEYQVFMKNYPDSLLVEAALFYTAKCCAAEKKYDKAVSYYKMLITDYKKGFWVDTAKDELVKLKVTEDKK